MDKHLALFSTILSLLEVSSALISWDNGCGSTKGCFPDCTGGCEYLVTWTDNPGGSNIAFTLQAEESETNVYLAIGFSTDKRMGEDSVVGCLVPGTTVHSYYNEDTETEELSTNTLGLTSTSVSQTSGVISCSFTRAYTAADAKFFDLQNNKYRLLLVIGEAGQENGAYKMEEHHMIPWMSAGDVDFTSHDIISEYKLNSPLVKLHGIMMVLAWLFLVIVSIVTARYNKDMLPETKLFGTKVWFQVHRGIMVVVMVFVVIGFIPIFVEVEGYSQITEQETVSGGAAHPILGIIVTALCFINPIMALFRPNPDHKLRWLFNWAHFGVGVVAQILAVVTIIIGYLLERANLSRSALWVTVAHLVVIVLVFLCLEVHKFTSSRKKDSVSISKVEMSNGTTMEEKPKQEDPKPSKLPMAVLVVFAVVAFAFAIAVLAIIAAG